MAPVTHWAMGHPLEVVGKVTGVAKASTLAVLVHAAVVTHPLVQVQVDEVLVGVKGAVQ